MAAVAGLPGLKASGVPQTDFLLGDNIESVDGQVVLGDHFDAGAGSPIVIIANEDNYEEIIAAAEQVEGISTVEVQADAEQMAEAYKKAAADAAAALEERTSGTTTSSSPGAEESTGGSLASDAQLAALREKLAEDKRAEYIASADAFLATLEPAKPGWARD